MAWNNRTRPETGSRPRRAARWRLDPYRQRRRRLAPEDPTATDVLPPAAPPPPKPAAKRTTVELLAEAEARVGDGERIIARQRDLIFDLRRKGLSSEEAEKLLRSFQNLQHEHEKHLVTLRIRARRGT